MATNEKIVEGVDVPIVKLTPLKKRSVNGKDFKKLKANLLAVGLIEPLCVCREDDSYYILDGYIRYQVLLELGVETVPCLVLKSKDFYTPNRQVNNLSRKQEIRMLRKALETLDEKTVAEAFGMQCLGSRLNTTMYKELDPLVIEALEKNKIYQQTAKELTYVIPKRQVEILALMEKSGDWSLPFAKAQILKTAQPQRAKKHKKSNPWSKGDKRKRDLVKKLTDVESHYDFYSTLYRKYVGDLLKLAIYVRQIMNREALLAHLEEKHPEKLELFQEILAESEGKAAG